MDITNRTFLNSIKYFNIFEIFKEILYNNMKVKEKWQISYKKLNKLIKRKNEVNVYDACYITHLLNQILFLTNFI